MALNLFHVSGTRSVRPLWLVLELGIEFKLTTIDYSESFRSTDEWRAISPAGKVPALQDGDLTLFESGAMVEYLLDEYDSSDRFRPAAGTSERHIYRQWCWFAEATLSRPIGLARLFRDSDRDGESLRDEAVQKSRTNLAALEQTLADQTFLIGDTFTAADIMTGYTLDYMDKGDLLQDFPATTRYLSGLRARPACAKALNA